MARRVGEPVTVKVRTDAEASAEHPAGAPTSFLWRGRLYVVRAVHGRWRERRAWWTSAVARAVHGVGEHVEDLDDPRGAGGRSGEGVRVLTPGTRVVLDHERTVWRVEASAGRMYGIGVYDLCQGATPEAWQLLRVSD